MLSPRKSPGRVKRFSVFDSSFLQDLMSLLGGAGPVLSPSRSYPNITHWATRGSTLSVLKNNSHSLYLRVLCLCVYVFSSFPKTLWSSTLNFRADHSFSAFCFCLVCSAQSASTFMISETNGSAVSFDPLIVHGALFAGCHLSLPS